MDRYDFSVPQYVLLGTVVTVSAALIVWLDACRHNQPRWLAFSALDGGLLVLFFTAVWRTLYGGTTWWRGSAAPGSVSFLDVVFAYESTVLVALVVWAGISYAYLGWLPKHGMYSRRYFETMQQSSKLRAALQHDADGARLREQLHKLTEDIGQMWHLYWYFWRAVLLQFATALFVATMYVAASDTWQRQWRPGCDQRLVRLYEIAFGLVQAYTWLQVVCLHAYLTTAVKAGSGRWMWVHAVVMFCDNVYLDIKGWSD